MVGLRLPEDALRTRCTASTHMRLVALLSFFDESPAFLHRLVLSLPLAGIRTLVALDGRYAHYPVAYVVSPAEQTDALKRACDTAGIFLCLHIGPAPWETEMAKRTALFEKGEHVTSERDWYLIVDGDEEIISAPADLHDQLEHTVCDVATADLLQEIPHLAFPKMFRAVRGLHVKGNHYTYATPDGRYLWGNGHTTRLEARHPTTMQVRHDERGRTPARRAGQVGYYMRRDHAHLEDDHPHMLRA